MSVTHEVIRLMLRKLGFKVNSSISDLYSAFHHKNVSFYNAMASGNPYDLFSYNIRLLEYGGDEVNFPLVSGDNFINLRSAIDRFFIMAANNPVTKFERRWHAQNSANRSYVCYGTVPIVGHNENFPYLKLFRGYSGTGGDYAYVWRIGGGVGLILYHYDRSSPGNYHSVVYNGKFTVGDALELVSGHCR